VGYRWQLTTKARITGKRDRADEMVGRDFIAALNNLRLRECSGKLLVISGLSLFFGVPNFKYSIGVKVPNFGACRYLLLARARQ